MDGEKAPPPPTSSAATSIALQTLRHLPTPLLVLSSSAIVLLVNEAIGRLLSLSKRNGEGEGDTANGNRETTTVEGSLIGQTLSQIGIDAVCDEERLAVNWEVCFSLWLCAQNSH